MSEFELFNQALDEYKKTTKECELISEFDELDNFSECQSLSDCEDKDSCSHLNIANERGMDVCIDCGEEITKKIPSASICMYLS